MCAANARMPRMRPRSSSGTATPRQKGGASASLSMSGRNMVGDDWGGEFKTMMGGEDGNNNGGTTMHTIA
jgi:hypothetical protein